MAEATWMEHMSEFQTLSPAQRLPAAHRTEDFNENVEYRTARNAFLSEEIDPRRFSKL